MHIHDTPRCKHRFLVGIAECAEYTRYTLDAFLHTKFVCGTGHSTDAFACRTEYLRVIVFLDAVELLFGYALGHELLPRLRVDERSEVVNGYLL